MGTTTYWVRAAAVLALAMLTAGEAAAYRTPEALIRAIYLPLLDEDGPPPIESRVYSADTLRLARDFQTRNPGGLGFSPFVDGQDYRLAAFDARQVRLDAVSADIVVSFTNFGEPRRLTYSMVREADGWRVDDISGMWASGPWAVRELLAAPEPPRIVFEAMLTP